MMFCHYNLFSEYILDNLLSKIIRPLPPSHCSGSHSAPVPSSEKKLLGKYKLVHQKNPYSLSLIGSRFLRLLRELFSLIPITCRGECLCILFLEQNIILPIITNDPTLAYINIEVLLKCSQRIPKAYKVSFFLNSVDGGGGGCGFRKPVEVILRYLLNKNMINYDNSNDGV